ncbi:MAG: SDR family oxidoreductase [Candidatus Kerfeldbacteria bacterium]|nr:SDR family oxidoreductase [Candidatus Kerfeldbacteria bacterium]
MDLGLKDKVVLITGASGGIGEATARAFAAEGAKVVIHYGKNQAAAETLRQKLPTESIAISANTADEASVAQLFAQAAARFGQVDITVANAGIFPPDDVPIHAMTTEYFDKVIATNLRGGWLTAREFFRLLAKTKPESACLILIGSTSGIFGEAGHSEYSMSKAALEGLKLTLKNEIVKLVPRGRVNMVAPGWTWTPMTEQFRSVDEAVITALQTRALQRIGRPEDIAHSIVMLASETASAYITGQTVVVSGGMEGRVLKQRQEIDPTKA